MEAPVNGGRNSDGPKVNKSCLSKIPLYAGIPSKTKTTRLFNNPFKATNNISP